MLLATEVRRLRRILVVAPQPFYQDRGTPIAVRQLLGALSELGYAADVLTFPVGESPVIAGVRYLRIGNPWRIREVPIGFSGRKLLLDAGLTYALWRRLRSGEYAAVHAVEEAAFPAVVIGRRYGVPVIYDMQSSLPEQLARYRPLAGGVAQRLLRGCEEWLLRRADVVACSRGLAERVRARVAGCRTREWNYVADFAAGDPADGARLRRELGIPDGVPVVVYTGTFETYQGLPLLLSAAEAVARRVSDVVFVLVGAEGAASQVITRRSAASGLNGRLRIVSRQPRERIAGFLQLADVLVSPRLYGGNLPLKIFDYLAAGRPIVATDIPTHRSLLSEERAVLVAPTADALADAIADVLLDPLRARSIAAAARHYSEENLSWMAFVRSVGELYADVLDGADE